MEEATIINRRLVKISGGTANRKDLFIYTAGEWKFQRDGSLEEVWKNRPF